MYIIFSLKFTWCERLINPGVIKVYVSVILVDKYGVGNQHYLYEVFSFF